jgi:PhnB protein
MKDARNRVLQSRPVRSSRAFARARSATCSRTPTSHFDGRCEAAFKFYAKTLGGKIEAMMSHKGTSVEKHVPAAWGKKILHARLRVGDFTLMGSDAPPERYQPTKGVSVALIFKDAKEGKRIFKALSKKGKVQMDFQETFWSSGFGTLTDQFGTPWMVDCEEAP